MAVTQTPQSAPPTRRASVLNRLRNRLSSTPEDAPPAFPPAMDASDVPQIPAPEVFTCTPLSLVSSSSGAKPVLLPPTLSQAAVHLELLEVFTELKRLVTVEHFDELRSTVLGGEGNGRGEHGDGSNVEGEKEEEKEREEERERLWKVFVELSVGRFEEWRRSTGERVETLVMEERTGPGGSRNEAGAEGSKEPGEELRKMPDDLMPPLDVLMVWHSYMLNPRCYFDDCHRLGFPSMLSVEFPWERIHAALASPNLFDKALSHLRSDPPSRLTHTIPCPNCLHAYSVPLVAHMPEHSWLDPAFALSCECGFAITHDSLAAATLRNDIAAILKGGGAGRGRNSLRGASSPPFAQGERMVRVVRETLNEAPTVETCSTLADIRGALLGGGGAEGGQGANGDDEALVRTLLGFYPLHIPPSSEACLDLTAAVLRQGSFVEKMHTHLWLYSPGLLCPLTSVPSPSSSPSPTPPTSASSPSSPPTHHGTLPRALSRYTNYFRLFRLFPNETLVPTLDVDLFWHTHQLTPVSYYHYTLAVAGRYIDHDDKLPGATLDDAFVRTDQRYGDTFEQGYAGCLCWFCEEALNVGLDPDGQEEEGPGVWGMLGRVGGWANGRRREESRRRWEVRVMVEFWRECRRRKESGEAMPGWSGLREVLQRGSSRS